MAYLVDGLTKIMKFHMRTFESSTSHFKSANRDLLTVRLPSN